MTSLMCMALAIHFEANGEHHEGKRMVAETIMNRVHHEDFPSTVCGVVFASSKSGKSCAFSWTCDGKPDEPNLKKKEDKKSWKESQEIAEETLKGENLIGTDALFFHSSKMKRPSSWKKMSRLGKVGNHIFYK